MIRLQKYTVFMKMQLLDNIVTTTRVAMWKIL